MTTLEAQKTGKFARADYAKDVLGSLGVPASDSNVLTLVIWNMYEGGHYLNKARYNLFNTTLDAPGAKSINKVGVKAYPDYTAGVIATRDTLNEPRYAQVRALLAGSAPPAQVLRALGDAGWIGAGKHYTEPNATTIAQARKLAGLPVGANEGDLGAKPLDLPGEGIAKNAAGALGGALGIGDLVGALLSGKTWVRVIEIVAGLVASVLGLVMIAKDLTGVSVPGVLGAVI